MKKVIFILLFIGLSFPYALCVGSQESANSSNKLQRLKQALTHELQEYTKCVKRGEHCDPKRKKVLYTAGAILAVLAIGAGAVTVRLAKPGWFKTSKRDRIAEQGLDITKELEPPEELEGEVSLADQEVEDPAEELQTTAAALEKLEKEKAFEKRQEKPLFPEEEGEEPFQISQLRSYKAPLSKEVKIKPVKMEIQEVPRFSDEQLRKKVDDMFLVLSGKVRAFGTSLGVEISTLQRRALLEQNLGAYQAYMQGYDDTASLQDQYDYLKEAYKILNKDLHKRDQDL